MTKREAIQLFGGKGAALARAIGVTPSAVYQWGEALSQEQSDRVRGAALRLGLIRECVPGGETPQQTQDDAA